ncbi:hypothetical protein BH23ACT5_BH23ACT5_12910 [soil metagenome]
MTPLAVVFAVLIAVPGPVADVGGHLERSGEADFSGEQLVTCDTPDGPRDSLFQIAQVDGSVLAWEIGSDEVLVSIGGGLTAMVTGGGSETVVLEGSTAGNAPVSYETHDTSSVSYLGRDSQEVSMHRDGTERVRMVIDTETGVVVRMRTFDADGTIYCDRRLISFSPGNGGVPDFDVDHDGEAVQRLEEAPSMLPEELAGFELVDTYAMEDGTLSYYSDGFFSFGVVVTDRPLGFAAGSQIVTDDTARGEYRRSYEAGRVTVAWTSATGSVAFIGDTPPDLTEEALEGLPDPVNPNLLERIWNRLFR